MKYSILKHPSLYFAEDIKDICKPLSSLQLDYFTHVNIDNHRQFSGIGTNPAFAKHYLDHQYYNSDIHLARENNLGNFIIWDAVSLGSECSNLIEDATQFGLQQSFTIIDKNETGHDFYHFSTRLSSKSISQICITNYDLLTLFILHFKDKVKNNQNLQAAYKMKFAIDDEAPKLDIKLINEDISTTNCRNDFLTEINPILSKTHLSKNKSLRSPEDTQLSLASVITTNEEFKLFTMRERECLYHMLTGKTAKETANCLNISFRTVEEHLDNIKQKSGFKSKRDLMSYYLQQLNFD